MKKIIRSKFIFDGIQEPYKGFLLIEHGKIKYVEHGWNYQDLLDEKTVLIKYDEQFIMPAIHDNHVFFSGYLSMNAGIDLSETLSSTQALEKIKEKIENTEFKGPIYGYGWDAKKWKDTPTEESLNDLNYAEAISIIDKDRTFNWMNAIAKQRYAFTENETSAESRVKLIKEMLSNDELLNEVYQKFEKLLLSKGVISIKEIVFDDCMYVDKLTHKTIQSTLYIQEVESTLDKSQLRSYKTKQYPDKVQFGGVKIMIDGVVADNTGDITGEYCSKAEKPIIDYIAIEDKVEMINSLGIPCCLTTEGDLAGINAAKILSRQGQQLPPTVQNSISDLEMITSQMAKKMDEGNIVAEIYPQILGLNESYEDAYMFQTIEKNQGTDFFNYRELIKEGVLLTSGTDLPLFITDIPESILRAVFRRFPTGDKIWNEKSSLTTFDVLKSFTENGFRANKLLNYGKLCSGMSASMVVYNQNLFTNDWRKLQEAEVMATYLDGEIIFEKV